MVNNQMNPVVENFTRNEIGFPLPLPSRNVRLNDVSACPGRTKINDEPDVSSFSHFALLRGKLCRVLLLPTH